MLTAAECAREAQKARKTPQKTLEATLSDVLLLISSEAKLGKGRCQIRLLALPSFPSLNFYQTKETMDRVIEDPQSSGFKVQPDRFNGCLFVEWMPAEEFDEKPNSVP